MFAKPADGFDVFAPENVAPLVGYLASPEAQRISGHVLIVWNKDVTVLGRPSTDTKFRAPSAGPSRACTSSSRRTSRSSSR